MNEELTEQFPIQLIRLRNRMPLRSDKPYDGLLIESESVPAKETEKFYYTVTRKRISKDDLLKKPKDIMQMFFPEYEVYCLPGDESKAAELIRQLVEKDMAEIVAHASAILGSVRTGILVMDKRACIDYQIGKAKDSAPKEI